MTLEQFRAKKGEVVGLLHELGEVAGGIGASSLRARVTGEVVPKLEAERFHLVVVGEFNHGKTTLVNALLGKDILPTGVTPTTAVIHHIEHADQPTARLVRSDMTSEPLAIDALRDWVARDGTEQRAQNVAYLEIGYPSALLRERIVLVDTPGVNDLSLSRADITYSYIPRSDAVLFLLDAGQLLKESERVFLFDKLIAKSRDKIVFVVTKADIWTEAERREGMEYVTRELGKLVEKPVIFPVAAELYLTGKPEESGIPALLEHLEHFLAEERGRILLDHALGEALATTSLLEKGIEAKRRSIAMSREELDRRIALVSSDREGRMKTLDGRRGAIREEVAAIKAWALRDLDNFVTDTVRQIPDVVDKAPAKDVKTHLGAFLESTFKEWANAETQEVANALEALAEKTIALINEDARETAKRLGDTLQLKAPTLEVNTFAYDVGIFALATVGIGTMFANLLLGGVLVLAAPLLALYVRDKVDDEVRKRAKELAPEALREAATKVGPKLTEMIDDFAKVLDAWVVSAGEEMHRELLEVLTVARAERDVQAASEDEARRGLEGRAGALATVKTKLERARAALWAKPDVVTA